MDSHLRKLSAQWPGTATLGAGGAAVPSAINQGGQGARLALHAELLPSLLPSEEAFSNVVDGLIQKNISGGKPSGPQITLVLLGDKYLKHCSSGKVLEDQKPTLVEKYTYT